MEMNLKYEDLQNKYRIMINDYHNLKDQDRYKVQTYENFVDFTFEKIYELQTKSDILEDEMRGVQYKYITTQKETEEHTL